MDVTVTNFRANLVDWLRRVREGEEVVVTERGMPVARVMRIAASHLIDELEEEGLVARPSEPVRPAAPTRTRVRARRSVAELVRNDPA